MSTTMESTTWHEMNHAYLTSALAAIRGRLEEYIASISDAPASGDRAGVGEPQYEFPPAVPPALETVAAAFGLSPFERDVLLLCAAVELDTGFRSLCAAAHGDQTRDEPTFSLALAALDGAHWSALTPGSPLRYWRLIEPARNDGLTRSPLRIDERILHYLVGVQHLDDRLTGFLEPLDAVAGLVPSHARLCERIAEIWLGSDSSGPVSIVQLIGDDPAAKNAIVAGACERAGLNVMKMDSTSLPAAPVEQEGLIRLWQRESVLSGSALLLDCQHHDATDTVKLAAIELCQRRMTGPLILVSEDRLTPSAGRRTVTLQVHKPLHAEQRELWQQVLGSSAAGLNGRVDTLVSQFNLSLETIQSVQAAARLDPRSQLVDNDPVSPLWEACRVQTRSRLNNLARRIEPAADWEALILPESQRELLQQIAAHVRERFTVYETWGFAQKGTRGLGISALFTGASGTGKTMAAEVLAGELRLDLYKIDLSQVVNKYIGETEKNLDRLFNAAEAGGAILFFDEADALFGKRSEVKDSHDRYANIEVSYLLQRMETYRGLAILATNLKNAIDPAFLRRIRFVIQFPFPDAAQRAAIWRGVFPDETPTDGLDVERLARLNITGGNIRNIALNGAFLAAADGQPVRMSHLLQAARTEYAKLDRQLTESEIGGWT